MFDGETGLEHYIIPGGYKMTFGNRTVRLGFKAHSGVFRIDKNNRKVLSFEQEWLDTEHCPDAASVTADDVRDLKRIVSFSANVIALSMFMLILIPQIESSLYSKSKSLNWNSTVR